jgi:hypothetical protein
MPEIGDDADVDPAERISAYADRHRDAWQQTLDDMDAMAEEREADGWETTTIPAGDTAPHNSEADDEDRFGLVFVVPDNYADEIEPRIEDGAFPAYEVYRQEVEGRVFVVVEYLDEDRQQAIYVAGNYELRFAGGMVEEAREDEAMYTYLQRLDTSVVGAFRHEGADAVEKFVPHADRIDEWLPNNPVGETEHLEDLSEAEPDEDA